MTDKAIINKTPQVLKEEPCEQNLIEDSSPFPTDNNKNLKKKKEKSPLRAKGVKKKFTKSKLRC